MSLAEIKAEIAKLTPEELAELKRELIRDPFDDPAYIAELTRRNRDAEQGERVVDDEEFRARLVARAQQS